MILTVKVTLLEFEHCNENRSNIQYSLPLTYDLLYAYLIQSPPAASC